MGSEKQFENKVKRMLEQHGIYPIGGSEKNMKTDPIGYYEKRWGGGFSKSGLPDMHIVVNTFSVDVEFKAEGGIASPLQTHMLKQINACGSIGVLLYPDGFDNFVAIIEQLVATKTQQEQINFIKSINNSQGCFINL